MFRYGCLMLNPVWLKTFITLIDTGHFTRAAEKLFMTQPGVSQHLNKLEQACGHALIQRENKGFEITEQGKLVYEYARQLLKSEQQLLENLAFDDPFAGAISMACSGAMALSLYPKILDLQVSHPDLSVTLKAAPNRQILEEVKQGLLDIAVVTELPASTIYDCLTLGEEALCLILPAAFDVRQLTAEALSDIGLVGHPDALHYLSIYCAQSRDPLFEHLNIEALLVTASINQISQILEPVARGLGFTVLPMSAIDSFHSSERLRIYQPRKKVMEPLYLLKKKGRALPARFQTLADVLQQYFGFGPAEIQRWLYGRNS
ncbi:MAG: LysR family transcriptional regulator [Candidatus Pelagadaptatus aseana]